jgi:hypothetical protein
MKALKKITSLNELFNLASEADGNGYLQLALMAAENLGGRGANLADSIEELKVVAMESSEKGVLREVNALRKFV